MLWDSRCFSVHSYILHFPLYKGPSQRRTHLRA